MFNLFNVLPLASQFSCAGSGDGSASGSGAGGGSFTWLIMLGVLIVFMLVMMIPQRKRDKKMKDMLASIKQGDRVRTIGGIYGTVTNIKDDVVTISVGPDKVRLVFARGAIATIEDAPVEATIDGEVKEVK